MALAEFKEMPLPPHFSRMRGHIKHWLAGEHSLTQRMAGTAFAIRVVSAAIVFLSQVLLARWMGDSEFGIYVYAWTWLMLVGELVHLGMPLTAQRFIPEYTHARAFALLRGYLAGSRWITFGAGTVAALLGALIVHAVEARLDSRTIMPFYLICIALPFYASTFMFDAMARSYNWINVALLPPYVMRPLLLVAGVAVARATGLAIDAITVTGALALATWLSALFQMAMLQRRLGTVVPPGGKDYDTRLWFNTALPIVLVWGMYTLLTATDVIVLKMFRPAGEVAHYYAAAKTLALVSIVQYAVAAASAHRFTAFHVAGDRAGLVAFAAGTVRWVFWPSLAGCVLMLLLGKPVLTLFGAGFSDGYPVIVILAIGQLARACIGPAERLLNVLGQQGTCAVAYAAAFAVNLIGCVMLAPRFGGIGVAYATAGAFVVESALLFLIARRRLGLHMFIWRRDA
ncbi:MAG TPA: polysaccharide biosynthesis C-terminal domain-containing protein [Pseudolabrys sp.]|jgi:O-antigen/teichoic acid export membrane protein